MNNKDHLDGQLTTMAGQTSKSQASKSTSNDKLFLACETCEYGKNRANQSETGNPSKTSQAEPQQCHMHYLPNIATTM